MGTGAESILGRAKVPITADLSGLNEDLKKAQKHIEDKLGASLKSVGQKMTSVGKQLSLKVTAPILGLGALVVKAASDFESAFAGVRKTVDATEEEYAALETGIRQMSKQISATPEEIAEVMEAAGQLGIAKDYLLDFTETMINLGVSTNMTSTDAAVSLARLANITQMPQDQFDELGSTVVALGNNLATTEADIVAMSLRLAGAGSLIGLTEAQTLGLAGALSSVGIEAQAGGSAVSRVMIDMANTVASATTGTVDNTAAIAKQRDKLGLLNSQLAIAVQRQSEFTDKTKESTRMSSQLRIDKYRDEIAATEEMLAQLESTQGKALDPQKLRRFAEIAGMNVGQFRDVFERDAAAAIVSFVEGLGRVEDEGGNLFAVLEELELSEIRTRDAMLRLSGAGGLTRQAMNLASEAFGENTALTEEAEKRYGTFKEQLKIVRNRLHDVAITIGAPLLPSIKDLIDDMAPLSTLVETLAGKFAELDPKTQAVAVEIGLLLAGVGPLLLLLRPLVTAIGTIGLPMVLAGLAVGGLAASFFLGSRKGETFRQSMHLLSKELSETEGLENLGKWVEMIADLFDILGKFGKGEYGLLFLITGKHPKEFFQEITKWGKGFFGTVAEPGAVTPYVRGIVLPKQIASIVGDITEFGKQLFGTAFEQRLASHQRIAELSGVGMPPPILKGVGLPPSELAESWSGGVSHHSVTVNGGINIVSPDPARAGEDVISELKKLGYLP